MRISRPAQVGLQGNRRRGERQKYLGPLSESAGLTRRNISKGRTICSSISPGRLTENDNNRALRSVEVAYIALPFMIPTEYNPRLLKQRGKQETLMRPPSRNCRGQTRTRLRTSPSPRSQLSASPTQTSYSGVWNSFSTAARKAHVRGLAWKSCTQTRTKCVFGKRRGEWGRSAKSEWHTCCDKMRCSRQSGRSHGKKGRTITSQSAQAELTKGG